MVKIREIVQSSRALVPRYPTVGQTARTMAQMIKLDNKVKQLTDSVKTKRSSIMSNFDFGMAFSSLLEAVSQSFTKVPVLVAILLSTYLIFTCGPRYNTGIIGDFISGSNNTIANWIVQNPNDFTGFLIFLPGVFAVPSDYGFLYLAASFLWVNVVPPAQMYEYLIQSIGLLTIFVTKDRKARTAVLMLVILSWLAGWLVLGTDKLNINTLPLNNNNISMHSYRK